jgi:23S rRNA maturation mini-RNase III
MASAKPRRSVSFIAFSPFWVDVFCLHYTKSSLKSQHPHRNLTEKKTKKDKKAKFLSLFINFSLTEEEKSYIMKGRNSMGRCKHEAVLFCGR